MTEIKEPTIADQIIQLIDHYNLANWAIGFIVFGAVMLLAFGVFWVIQWRKISREVDEIRREGDEIHRRVHEGVGR